MADDLLNPVVIGQDTLIRLENDCTMTKMVSREFDDKFAVPNQKCGYIYNARLPVRLRGRRGDGAKPEGIQEQMVPIAINELWGQDLQSTDQDLTLSIDRYGERYIEPAAATIGNMIDGDLCDVFGGFFNAVGTPGTDPNSIATYATARAALVNMAVPMVDSMLAMVISPDMEVAALGFNQNLFHPEAEISKQYLTGKLGKALSFRWNSDPNVARHTVGALGTAGAITSNPVVAAVAAGGASVSTTGWDASINGILNKNDIVSFAGAYAVNPISYRSYGKLRTFTVTEDVNSAADGTATIKISPPMVADATSPFQTVTALAAAAAQVYVFGLDKDSFSTIAGVQSAQALAFHKEAIVLAVVKQELPGGMEWSEWVANPKMGIGIRLVRGYLIGSNEKITRLDVLGGVKRVRDEMGIRVCGA